jgi:hypothetical protein
MLVAMAAGRPEGGSMDFGTITKKAKEAFKKRGGAGAAKEDVGELKDIATGQGTPAEKAKQAAAAIKDPGAPGQEGAAQDAEAPKRG